MARAYSLDLRERVVAAVDDGRSCRQVAGLFRVSVAQRYSEWAWRTDHRALADLVPKS
jgi:transposase